MSIKKVRLRNVLPALIAGLALAIASCGKAADAPPAQDKAAGKTAGKVAGQAGGKSGFVRDPVPVRIAEVIEKTMPVQISNIGAVEPIQSVQLKAQVSGQVVEVLFKEGDMVQKDQVLFTIDKRPFEVALHEAEANLAKSQALLEQARATLERDKAQAENARAVLARDQALFEKKFISPEEFDNSRTQAEASKALVAADEASAKSAAESIGVAKSSIDEAKLQLDYCTIRSPLTGRSGAVMVKVGNLVRANDSTPMVVINQLDPIYVSFSLSEEYLGEIQRLSAQNPLQVTVSVHNQPGDPLKGVLTFVDNSVENGAIALKATFDNKENRLWPGLPMDVILQMTENANAIVAPTRAVQSGQQGTYVFVINKDMKAEVRKISVGDAVAGLTVVKEGLKPGEKVVTDGQARLATDMPVRILDTPAPAPGAPAA